MSEVNEPGYRLSRRFLANMVWAADLGEREFGIKLSLMDMITIACRISLVKIGGAFPTSLRLCHAMEKDQNSTTFHSGVE